ERFCSSFELDSSTSGYLRYRAIGTNCQRGKDTLEPPHHSSAAETSAERHKAAKTAKIVIEPPRVTRCPATQIPSVRLTTPK
ncbi:hypothetical protein E3P86_04074, partial [Wallemia ichthyophaga]